MNPEGRNKDYNHSILYDLAVNNTYMVMLI